MAGAVDDAKLETVKGRVGMIFEAYGLPLSTTDVLRFVTASKGDVDQSSKLMMEYCNWRQQKPQYGVEGGFEDCLKPENVRQELDSGKAYVLPGKTMDNQPIVLVHGKLNDSTSPDYDIEQTTRFTIYMIEMGIQRMEEDEHKLTVVFNLEGITMKAVDYKFLKRLVYILAHYYPERLGTCLIVNAPGFFSGCWALISPWLEKDTAQKVKFVNGIEKLREYIPDEEIPMSMGGSSSFVYSPPAL